MGQSEFFILLAGVAVAIVLQIVSLLRGRSSGAGGTDGAANLALLQQHQQQSLERIDRVEREVRLQLQASAQSTRQELSAGLAQFHAATVQQLDSMRAQIHRQGQSGREEQAQSLARFADSTNQSLAKLTESNAQRLLEVRATLESKIRDLQADNGMRLEEMRKTVDEKLHATLETRLSESFKQVSERLERVHQGLGEMQQLALGVGDLKRVLTNVKTRGTWGEVQLEMLLEQVLTVDQYAKNVETIAGSGARVEFALKLPGLVDGGPPVWMPIDAKFPKEQYERLVDAAERADAEGVASAGRELERAVRGEAKTIAEKYLAPPHTTDFAILFLPTEGLYAEVMRRAGLADDLQRVHRISIAGPSTLSALLNSLQMGFRTLALEKRSSEVWQVLGAVKTEFGKFGEVLSQTKLALERAAKNIESAEVRSRQMARKLKSVEALPGEAAQLLLGADSDDSQL
ncbi:DNA recombination protein RmuC [Janthinobacterium agaricidamnosum]|uniref:RmuC family protein n=1 Tax=Janthinobacterium agaricidamnosum NBRC 102515 = DSM 9628 TaxID=1349767 RepID=W0V3K1_9BURK|nr:DNA recombination protein RmuC [Janthinobacterium agaricidamnosum]CDG81852.1 rmuC family protein [Janthinobacterium agaricidamnosum NBRC 102515 = DSM 9628]